MTKETTSEPSKESSGKLATTPPVPPEYVTPVKEETKPIATTPKLRGKRNINQPECEKPQDEYSAEADDEMEEEIKLCNKKKLMVALKDINADKKLVEGSSVKMHSLEQRDNATTSSSAMASVSTPSKTIENLLPTVQNSPTDEKAPPTQDVSDKSISDKSISDRHSVAVAKKTKKQKIIENEMESAEMPRDEFKASNERLDEQKSGYENDRKERAERKLDDEEKVIKVDKTTSEAKVEIPVAPPPLQPPPPLPTTTATTTTEKDDDTNELGSDDMEICDDTTNTTPVYEPPKFSSPPKNTYSKLDRLHTPPKESHSVEQKKEVSLSAESKSTEIEASQPSNSNSNTSPNKPHEKWTHERLRSEQSAIHDVKSVVVKANENVDERSPTKSASSSTVISPTKIHENVVKSPSIDVSRPNVIVDAQSESQETLKHQLSPVKGDQTAMSKPTIVESPEQKAKTEKQLSPEKLSSSPTIINPKTSPTVCPSSESTNVPTKVDEKESSPNKHGRKNSASDFEAVNTEANKSKVIPVNRTEHISPREKLPPQSTASSVQLSPEKSRDSKNSVIKSVNEPMSTTSSDCVPLSGSTVGVSKNDETKTTTQDFCQRIDPNKTPQCVKSDGKVETKHEPFKLDHSSPPKLSTSSSSSSSMMEKSMRLPDNIKTPPKDTKIIQPKEEPNRMDTATPDLHSANGNQQSTATESTKGRYKQQQSHTSSKQSHSSSKSQSGEHKKSTSSSCSQTSHYDIKRESKMDVKSNSGYASNESAMRRESPTKRDSSSKQSTGYGSSSTSSSSSKNFSNESMSSGSGGALLSSGEKRHSATEKKSTSNEKKSNSAEKKQPEMRGNIDTDLNKMRPQFAMNQLPNYHTAHQYYNLSPWDAYNYHSGYNLPHLDPSATQKSPTKFHKDLANSMYGGMTSNYLAANSLAAQQSQQQQQQNTQQIQSNLQYQHQQQVRLNSIHIFNLSRFFPFQNVKSETLLNLTYSLHIIFSFNNQPAIKTFNINCNINKINSKFNRIYNCNIINNRLISIHHQMINFLANDLSSKIVIVLFLICIAATVSTATTT